MEHFMLLEFKKKSIFYAKKTSSVIKQQSFSNDVYAFSCEDCDYIYKEFKGLDLIHQLREKELIELLYKLNLTCELIEFETDSYMVTRKIEGRGLSSAEFKEWKWIESLKSLHTHTYGVEIFKLEEEILKLYAATTQKLKYQNAVEHLKHNLSHFEGLYDKLSLCHLDLNPGNIFKTNSGFLFIDFEFTMMSSALIDISQMLAHLEINQIQEESLLRLFELSSEDRLMVKFLKKYSYLYWSIWCSQSKKSKNWESYYFERYLKA